MAVLRAVVDGGREMSGQQRTATFGVPNCDVAVTELMEAGQYEELRSQLDACILSDPTAPADVADAARDAKAQAL